MAMVQQDMPSANKKGFGQGHSAQPDQHASPSLSQLTGIDRVVMIDDNTCCEKIKQGLFPPVNTCFCPRRYRLSNVGPAYAEGDKKLYTIVQTGCCCPEQWTLKSPEGQNIHTYSRTHGCYICCSTLCGGPGMDVHDAGQKGGRIGAAFREACQCFNKGYDILDEHSNKKYFVGNPAFCCSSSKYFTPVWNEDKTEVLKMHVHVIPFLKKTIPCFFFWMKDYYVLDFPVKATSVERSDLVAGAVMADNTFM